MKRTENISMKHLSKLEELKNFADEKGINVEIYTDYQIDSMGYPEAYCFMKYPEEFQMVVDYLFYCNK